MRAGLPGMLLLTSTLLAFAGTGQAGDEIVTDAPKRISDLRCRVDSFYSTLNAGDRALFAASPEAAAGGEIPFAFEDLSHPRLALLREKYGLEDIVGDGRSEIDRMALMRNWVKSRWAHKTPRVFPRWDAFAAQAESSARITTGSSSATQIHDANASGMACPGGVSGRALRKRAARSHSVSPRRTVWTPTVSCADSAPAPASAGSCAASGAAADARQATSTRTAARGPAAGDLIRTGGRPRRPVA